MRIKRTNNRSVTARRVRTTAVVAGLAAVAALAVPTANAETPRTFSADQLTAAGDAVLGADIAGTAWNIDPQSKRLVVTVDSTVSRAEIDRIKKSAEPTPTPCASNAPPGSSPS
ncbi:S1 family peptidase [Streptomyces californicus]